MDQSIFSSISSLSVDTKGPLGPGNSIWYVAPRKALVHNWISRLACLDSSLVFNCNTAELREIFPSAAKASAIPSMKDSHFCSMLTEMQFLYFLRACACSLMHSPSGIIL